jgi:hypothetical protein
MATAMDPIMPADLLSTPRTFTLTVENQLAQRKASPKLG